MKNIELLPLEENDIHEIVSSFDKIGWNKAATLFEKYKQEEAQDIRAILIARIDGKFAGYVTLKWQSDYNSIPEIIDLNVLPLFRNNGIGTMLIQRCEEMAKERGYSKIGLGVGMTADYGDAQHLYIRLGYLPDKNGIHYQTRQLQYGDKVVVDDDLVLYFKKSI